MKSPTPFFLRFAGVIHWLGAIFCIVISPMLLILWVISAGDDYALLMFFLPLVGGILLAIQAGLLGNAEKKSILLGAILTVYFLIFLLIIPLLKMIPVVGLGVSGITLLYLIIAKSKIAFTK